MFKPDEQREQIDNLRSEIARLLARGPSCPWVTGHLADTYKALADAYANAYLNAHVLENSVKEDHAEEATQYYEKAAKLFARIGMRREQIYSTMACGNAWKERFLPGMGKKQFDQWEKEARQKYDECVGLCYKDGKVVPEYVQDYHFVMLEQKNLIVRKKVWNEYEYEKKEALPRRVVVLHSLRSAESHICLDGLCYFGYRNNCEIWEYRFGKVTTFDKEEKYIRDRLGEASAVIFLASGGYDPEKSEIVKFEIDTVRKMKEHGDPVAVFVVGLGNRKVVKTLKSLAQDVRHIPPKALRTIFTKHRGEIPHIYECRKWRLLDC